MRIIDGQSSKTYRVRWEIDIDADTPQQAAKRAQVIMQDTSEDNLATVFQVYERMEPVKMEEIDLGDIGCVCSVKAQAPMCPVHANRGETSKPICACGKSPCEFDAANY